MSSKNHQKYKKNYYNLKAIPKIPFPQQIIYLYLSHNQIHSIPSLPFPNLKFLNLSYNAINDLQNLLHQLQNLQYIWVHHNPFTNYCINYRGVLFREYKSLKKCDQYPRLKISKNDLQFIKQNYISALIQSQFVNMNVQDYNSFANHLNYNDNKLLQALHSLLAYLLSPKQCTFSQQEYFKSFQFLFRKICLNYSARNLHVLKNYLISKCQKKANLNLAKLSQDKQYAQKCMLSQFFKQEQPKFDHSPRKIAANSQIFVKDEQMGHENLRCKRLREQIQKVGLNKNFNFMQYEKENIMNDERYVQQQVTYRTPLFQYDRDYTQILYIILLDTIYPRIQKQMHTRPQSKQHCFTCQNKTKSTLTQLQLPIKTIKKRKSKNPSFLQNKNNILTQTNDFQNNNQNNNLIQNSAVLNSFLKEDQKMQLYMLSNSQKKSYQKEKSIDISSWDEDKNLKKIIFEKLRQCFQQKMRKDFKLYQISLQSKVLKGLYLSKYYQN